MITSAVPVKSITMSLSGELVISSSKSERLVNSLTESELPPRKSNTLLTEDVDKD